MKKAQKTRRKSHFSLLLRLAIAALASWLILKDLDFPQLAETFKRLNLLILTLAMVIYTLAQGLVGFRWWLVLKAQQIRVPLVFAVKLTLLGHFFSQFMPSSVGGDLVRAWYVSRYSDKKLQAALGVAVDRIVGLISTFLLAFGSYFLFMRGQDILQISRDTASIRVPFLQPNLIIPLILSSLFIITGLIILLLSFKTFKLMLFRLYRHGVHFFTQLQEVVKVYYHHPAVFIFSLIITILLQSLVILSYWAIGQNLRIAADMSYYFVFFPMVWAFGSIPISIAGIGILEGGLVFLFVKFAGADTETAITLALCQRLTWLVAAVPGLWFHLVGAHRKQSEISIQKTS